MLEINAKEKEPVQQAADNLAELSSILAQRSVALAEAQVSLDHAKGAYDSARVDHQKCLENYLELVRSADPRTQPKMSEPNL